MTEEPRDPAFHTLDSASAAARERAMAERRRYFVVGFVADTAPRANFGPAPRPGTFDAVPQEGLESLILGTAETARAQLAILRVATPDGAVEAVDDPGDREGRLVAFCTSG